ncbi:MAG: site-specific integrase [Treponema sp.]|jgi:integrase|nr:site-specific integrase [Treponema sp.]
MGVKVREKRGKLYLDIYLGGKRTWESLHLTLTNDKNQNKEILRYADICRSKRETQLLTSSWDIQDPIAGRKKLITYLEERAKERVNNDYITGCIRYLKEYANGSTIQLSQITPQWIDGFQKYLLNVKKKNGTVLSATTAYDYSKAIRMALRKAVRDNVLIKNPAESVKGLPEPETELIFLNVNEVQKLADVELGGNLGAEVRRAFVFACYTGLRISDIKSLKWGDIERDPLQIIKRQKKTQRTAYIPLKDTAWKLIDDGNDHNPDDKIFYYLSRGEAQTNSYLKKWAKKAGVNKPVGWHTARRTFATWELENGADIYTVAKLLGHKNIKQVAKYAQATDKLRRNAVDALPEITLAMKPAVGE